MQNCHTRWDNRGLPGPRQHLNFGDGVSGTTAFVGGLLPQKQTDRQTPGLIEGRDFMDATYGCQAIFG
jgi:hypothetical protein